jgi:S1-C subfamily serine protease
MESCQYPRGTSSRVERGATRRSVMTWIAGLLLAVTIAGIVVAGDVGPVAAQTVKQVFEKVAPSVVVIRARGREVTTRGLGRYSETGSGVLVSADGKVMTAAHVVHTLDEISVQFLGGETVAARVVASEPAADLSLLQLERVPPGAPAAVMANTNGVDVGDPVIIVGAPYGLSYALSVGHISARWAPNTVYRSMPLAEFFQTDAVINTGNSGGPMFNMKGEVIGIVSHNISKGGGSEGLGFVVTLNTARALLLDKKSFWSGIEFHVLTEQLADLLNVPDRQTGILVKTVAKDSPADRIGLRGATMIVPIAGEEVPLGGDIIMSVLGIPATAANAEKIRDALNQLPPGAEFKTSILRAGHVLELTGRAP